MRPRVAALLLAGAALHGVTHAADDVGWYTASARAPSVRSYWIAGGEGLVLLGTQLLPSEAEAMLREAQSRTGRKPLMAVVLAPTPEQFNGTAAHADAVRRLSAQFGKDYPAAEPKPASFGDASRQMLIGGVQFHLRALGPGVAVAHVAVEYDGQVFAGDLLVRVKNRMLEAYPAYALPEHLDALVAAEWQRQAGNAAN